MFEGKRFVGGLVLLAVLCATLLSGCAPSKPAAAEPFALIVLPDTQNYADARKDGAGRRAVPDYSRYFYDQTRWIRQDRDKRNIVMVAHVGDIVQTDHPGEWQIADKAFKTIDGAVPYVLALGNHDLAGGRADSRETRFNDHFPPSRLKTDANRGGHFGGGNENHYVLFEAGGMKFLIVALEFAPRDVVLEWANRIVARHADRRAIVVTHAYLDNNGRRIARPAMGYRVKGNSAEDMWQKFVSRHKNVFLVLSGHAHSCRLESVGEHGNVVHQIQSDYQFIADGGSGYLRIMVFVPSENRIDVRTYSPTAGLYATTPTDQFSVTYSMGGAARAE